MPIPENITLYRGLNVPAANGQAIQQRILNGGINGNEGAVFRVVINDIRWQLEELFKEPNLTTDDTRIEGDQFPVVFAGGDSDSTAHYTRGGNIRRTPLLVTFEAPIEDVYVDGRDFLYTAFQFADNRKRTYGAQCKWLAEMFGEEILKYFRKAARTRGTDKKIALCDLAIQDVEVVIAHLRNRIVIEGKNGVIFRTAFQVRPPITPDRITSVEIPVHSTLEPDINIAEFCLEEQNLPGPPRHIS